MARIVVLGGGVCGLAAGLMLARDGHEITLFERDSGPVPDSAEEAWEGWPRDGVTQFRQAHLLQPAGRAVLEEELPDVFAALVSGGAKRLDLLALMPPTITDRTPRPGDERFVTHTARRPTIERVLAAAAEEQPGMDVRRGTVVKDLTVASSGGTPRVTGVVLDSGDAEPADLVVDAMGRGSQLPRWLRDAGLTSPHEESEDSGFIYYTRFFKSADGSTPQVVGPMLAAMGSFSLLTIPADNGTWSVTAYVSSGDKPLKAMRDTQRWTSVIEACPLQAHWLDGEPMGDVMAMGGVVDRQRRLFDDGRPSIAGIALLGDAWACTNPSLGRGMTLGLIHARHLRDTLRSGLEDPDGLAEAWDALTLQKMTPWYRATVEEDRNRLREIEALREGREPEPASGPSADREATVGAMFGDADIFRAFLEDRSSLKPLSQTLSEGGMAERVRELAGDSKRVPLPGPSREDLLALLG